MRVKQDSDYKAHSQALPPTDVQQTFTLFSPILACPSLDLSLLSIWFTSSLAVGELCHVWCVLYGVWSIIRGTSIVFHPPLCSPYCSKLSNALGTLRDTRERRWSFCPHYLSKKFLWQVLDSAAALPVESTLKPVGGQGQGWSSRLTVAWGHTSGSVNTGITPSSWVWASLSLQLFADSILCSPPTVSNKH